jgi:tRNA-dihydrouridine synthase B
MKPIGTFTPNNPFFLAPLAGITDAPTRLLAKSMGASLVYTEMVSGKGLMYNNKNTQGLLRIHEEEKPVAIQIFGCEPEVMGYTARELDSRENVILDINMGCPVPKVTRYGEGSAMMKDPKNIFRVVEAAVQNTTKPVTIKIRSGWDADSINATEVAKQAEAAGAAAVAVHGRTRDQFYTGKADWSVISDVVRSVSIPVIGNGDIFHGEDALAMLDQTGCEYVMIARGALGNPWIFREAVALYEGRSKPEPPTTEEKIAMLIKHLDLAVAEKGERVAVMELRKHVGWYLKGEHGATAVRRQVNQITAAAEFRSLLESLLEGRVEVRIER